jgi:hypothetical protein
MSNHMPAVTPVASYSLALDYHQLPSRVMLITSGGFAVFAIKFAFIGVIPAIGVAIFTLIPAFILIPSSFALRVVEHLPQPITLQTTFVTHVSEFTFDGNAFLRICHLTLVLLFGCM